MIPSSTTHVPLLETVSTVQVRTLHAVEECDTFHAFCAHAHFNPCASVVLPSASAVQSIKAALAEEVFALIAEEHGVPLVALDADLHLCDPFLFYAHCLLILADQISVTVHEVPEVLNILNFALFFDAISIMPQGTLQHMYQVRLIFDVDTKYSSHLNDIVNGLHERVLTRSLRLPCEDVGKKKLNPELHNGLPVRHWLLVSCDLEHLPELVIVGMLPGSFAGALIHPVDHAILHILCGARRQGLFLERSENPKDVLVCGGVHTQISHVLL
mmetsp:Transcript_72687/g.101021  ORF Transcript_72687/g.101021 Transcript_72687/m.101021 type:complete len:271 (-) Transcript_72687:636-1448(-)